MKKVHFFYLAGFTVKARSRDRAVRKFIRVGFAAFVAEQETRRLHAGTEVKPLAYLEAL